MTILIFKHIYILPHSRVEKLGLTVFQREGLCIFSNPEKNLLIKYLGSVTDMQNA